MVDFARVDFFAGAFVVVLRAVVFVAGDLRAVDAFVDLVDFARVDGDLRVDVFFVVDFF